MQKITESYLMCALWSTTDENEQAFNRNYSISDFSKEAIEKAESDCQKFLVLAGGLPNYNSSIYSDEEMTGHDIWLTRNGHGSGFWDRETLERNEGMRLSNIADKMGNVDLYLGDDNKLHLT